MLQQTKVKTVIRYFKAFLRNFPTLKALSLSKESKVLKLWEGLGYYRRARNLLATSRILVNEHNSKLPKELINIKKLPGVGDYTANALSAFIHEQPTIAIDGNVKRVFSRVLNKNENEIDYKKLIEINKTNLLETKRNSDFVEALMEFGALICKPKEPKCPNCIIKNMCKYFKSDKKFQGTKVLRVKIKNYNILCYIDKMKKKIALTKKNNLGFLDKFYLPLFEETQNNEKKKNWTFHSNFKNSISNKKLNINLYYKFSFKIPSQYKWFSLKKNNEFIPTFTKKIFKKILK